jgi:hypothetical protein
MKNTVNIKKRKPLFYGIFNFHNEIKREYAYAYTKEQAKIVMGRRIAKKQGVLPVVVLGWLKDHPNSFEIKIERWGSDVWKE